MATILTILLITDQISRCLNSKNENKNIFASRQGGITLWPLSLNTPCTENAQHQYCKYVTQKV